MSPHGRSLFIDEQSMLDLAWEALAGEWQSPLTALAVERAALFLVVA